MNWREGLRRVRPILTALATVGYQGNPALNLRNDLKTAGFQASAHFLPTSKPDLCAELCDIFLTTEALEKCIFAPS